LKPPRLPSSHRRCRRGRGLGVATKAVGAAAEIPGGAAEAVGAAPPLKLLVPLPKP